MHVLFLRRRFVIFVLAACVQHAWHPCTNKVTRAAALHELVLSIPAAVRGAPRCRTADAGFFLVAAALDFPCAFWNHTPWPLKYSCFGIAPARAF